MGETDDAEVERICEALGEDDSLPDHIATKDAMREVVVAVLSVSGLVRRDEVERLRAAAKRVLEADMRGVRDLDALNALEDAAGFSQQGQRRFPAESQRERADCPTCGDAVFAPLMEELAGLRTELERAQADAERWHVAWRENEYEAAAAGAELERAEAELRQAREALEKIAALPGDLSIDGRIAREFLARFSPGENAGEKENG